MNFIHVNVAIKFAYGVGIKFGKSRTVCVRRVVLRMGKILISSQRWTWKKCYGPTRKHKPQRSGKSRYTTNSFNNSSCNSSNKYNSTVVIVTATSTTIFMPHPIVLLGMQMEHHHLPRRTRYRPLLLFHRIQQQIVMTQ